MKLHRRSKNNKKPVIRQVLDLVPEFILRHSIRKYQSDKGCHKYKTYDQLNSAGAAKIISQTFQIGNFMLSR